MRRLSRKFVKTLEELACSPHIPNAERLLAAKILVQYFTTANDSVPAPSSKDKDEIDIKKFLEQMK